MYYSSYQHFENNKWRKLQNNLTTTVHVYTTVVVKTLKTMNEESYIIYTVPGGP